MSILDSEKIKLLRNQKGLEQRELAALAQVDPSVISRLERGLQQDFKLSVVVNLAKALGVPIDILITRDYRVNQEPQNAEIQAVITKLSQHSDRTQSLVAGMVNGFLSALESENLNGG